MPGLNRVRVQGLGSGVWRSQLDLCSGSRLGQGSRLEAAYVTRKQRDPQHTHWAQNRREVAGVRDLGCPRQRDCLVTFSSTPPCFSPHPRHTRHLKPPSTRGACSQAAGRFGGQEGRDACRRRGGPRPQRSQRSTLQRQPAWFLPGWSSRRLSPSGAPRMHLGFGTRHLHARGAIRVAQSVAGLDSGVDTGW